MLSVNQMIGQIKLLEIWNAKNIVGHPFQLQEIDRDESVAITRASSSSRLVESMVSNKSQRTFKNDAIHI